MAHDTISQGSALQRGIKTIGIGKRGSKPLPPGLIQEILQEAKQGTGSPSAWGAFWGALFIKGLTEDEKILFQAFAPGTLENPARLIDTLSPEVPSAIKAIAVRLLNAETLDQITAQTLGDFLLSDLPTDALRGLIASLLRVRYETDDEYAGLLASLQNTIVDSFKTPVPKGDPVIQFAEPFDGVDHSFMITPVVADTLQKSHTRVVSLVGRNSGPKLVFNLFDVAQKLNGRLLKIPQDLGSLKPPLGWYLNQADLSPAMDRWVDIRRQTIKRPFMATLERFVNPLNADVIIASAFHPPYGEKMLNICERAGFKRAIIVRNGIEGTVAFPLMRSAKILCSAQNDKGIYERGEFEFNPMIELGVTVEKEDKMGVPSLQENVDLINAYLRTSRSGNALFDLRIKATCQGLQKALQWVSQVNPFLKKDL
jgi:anthranilate phosphoribosyltransferase